MAIVNTAILKHPLNWLTVLFMLLIAGFVVDIVVLRMQHGSGAPALVNAS